MNAHRRKASPLRPGGSVKLALKDPMTRTSRRITSADVARAAGVSRTTVSFVLNDRPGLGIPEGTRRRVLDAARELGYRPHAFGRALRAGRSDIVLLSVPGRPVGAGLSWFIEELAAALAARNLTLVSHLQGAGGRPLADVCAAIGATAVMGTHPFDSGTVDALYQAGAAVILPSPDADIPSPMRELGRFQAGHLLSRGHQRLGYALPASTSLRRIADERLEGAAEACAGEGLDTPVAITAPAELADMTGAVRRWREQAVTGVCAYNDETAIAVLVAARSAGLTVPDDLAVIGAGDTPAAPLAVPPLTTVGYDHRQIAKASAEALAASLADSPSVPVPPRAEPLLIHRSST